jgi:hypothetical protein
LDVPVSDELRYLYLKTLVEIEIDGTLIPVGRALAGEGAAVHIITAWNPGDDRPTLGENEAANERLRETLISGGLVPTKAVGADPDSNHTEESWAVVGLDDQEARAIGASFGQVAVFRIFRGTQTVLACTEDWSLSRPL